MAKRKKVNMKPCTSVVYTQPLVPKRSIRFFMTLGTIAGSIHAGFWGTSIFDMAIGKTHIAGKKLTD